MVKLPSKGSKSYDKIDCTRRLIRKKINNFVVNNSSSKHTHDLEHFYLEMKYQCNWSNVNQGVIFY